jgi:hypothetical protein
VHDVGEPYLMRLEDDPDPFPGPSDGGIYDRLAGFEVAGGKCQVPSSWLVFWRLNEEDFAGRLLSKRWTYGGGSGLGRMVERGERGVRLAGTS